MSSTHPPSALAGLTGDVCKVDSDCFGNRDCYCGENSCFCRPDGGIMKCSGPSDCPAGEVCLLFDNGSKNCLSQAFADSSGWPIVSGNDPGVGDGTCVATLHLDEQGVKKEDRVFAKDYYSWVLCDASGSCATSGHMVAWNGQMMMMKTYCEVGAAAGCERKVMSVNSMKYKRRGRVESKTDGLQFGVFAAKWATSTEEVVLRGLMRMGL